ncbi:MAG TPA: PLP-dependent aminotransferase family protein [Herpetosiphonaceae bacterium]
MLDTVSPSTEPIPLAGWARSLQPSAIQDMLALLARPGLLSFALGLPAAELFPKEHFAQAVAQVVSNDPVAFQYQPTLRPLKTHIVRLMQQRGVTCCEEQVFITTGAQQAMNLLIHLLLDPGGQVLTEEIIYSGLQQAIAPFQPEILTVSTDLETGVDVDAVEALLASGARPAFMYAMSAGHNPLSISMSAEKRSRLVELARRYHMPILEDDAYGFLYYDGQGAPPMRALDDQWVFYLGSFSKTLMPTLRVGWLIVPEELIEKLSVIKESSDINTSTFTQRAICAYLDAGHLPAHLDTLRQEYGIRRDAMHAALERHFPREARWKKPSHGMFFWVELPSTVDTGEALRVAVEQENVAFIPGHAFAVGNSRQGANCMRLNFSNCPPELIEEGIGRLGRVLRSL